jgi:hypothetical protein
MTKKTRNRLIALFIVAFPFALFVGFLIFMQEPMKPKPHGPQKTAPSDPAAGTNMVSPP